MNKQSLNPEQLSFSIGRPLPVLLEEIQKSSRNPQLIKAAEQMLEGLHTLEIATEIDVYTAIYEILTK
ncbi:hypothetical protein [Nostoc sp. 'Peltigera malacea cyanobiont' DB3992]|uniref:hypothetical protein n=1 Tax=Nostoc sp. 'Peltigera malacea cyanobiont' DB3992 TaxID=1206980 RepID=UPI000C046F13|nr:hypothetical protein [Nostoc sp. 'Peltigera malacea cyanobiont' DB3992]PHM11124.1 hypothetical protein CK516_04390 [Nostoc sp. 'Peltigera malacea cyanobiont' DB3992]